MATIGEKTIGYAHEVIGHLLNEHLDGLDQAYRHADGGIDCKLNIHVEPGNAGTNAVSISIAFTQLKVKEKTDPVEIDENQGELFGGKQR